MKFVNILQTFLILIFSLSIIYADTNGVWNKAEDIRGGIIGDDEQVSNMNYTFINPVYFFKRLLSETGEFFIDIGATSKLNEVYAEKFTGQKIFVQEISAQKIESPNLCLGGVCKTSWPIPSTTSTTPTSSLSTPPTCIGENALQWTGSSWSCVTVTKGCSDECSYNGQKSCSSSKSKTCGNYDSDSCLEWSSSTSCSYGCSGSSCDSAPVPPSCNPSYTDYCSSGSIYSRNSCTGALTSGSSCANGCSTGSNICNTPAPPVCDISSSFPFCNQGDLWFAEYCTSGSSTFTFQNSCSNGCTSGGSSCDAPPVCDTSMNFPFCNQGDLWFADYCSSGSYVYTFQNSCSNGCTPGGSSCDAPAPVCDTSKNFPFCNQDNLWFRDVCADTYTFQNSCSNGCSPGGSSCDAPAPVCDTSMNFPFCNQGDLWFADYCSSGSYVYTFQNSCSNGCTPGGNSCN